MLFTMTGKHIEITEALKAHAQEKSEKLPRYYNSINHETGFAGLVKGQMGTRTLQWTVSDSITVSPVVTMPPEAVAVILSSAESNMFQFWVSHRALYDQYTTLAGVQSLDIGELLGMIRTGEDRADRRYKRLRKPPTPTRTKTRIRGDL